MRFQQRTHRFLPYDIASSIRFTTKIITIDDRRKIIMFAPCWENATATAGLRNGPDPGLVAGTGGQAREWTSSENATATSRASNLMTPSMIFVATTHKDHFLAANGKSRLSSPFLFIDSTCSWRESYIFLLLPQNLNEVDNGKSIRPAHTPLKNNSMYVQDDPDDLRYWREWYSENFPMSFQKAELHRKTSLHWFRAFLEFLWMLLKSKMAVRWRYIFPCLHWLFVAHATE